MLNNKFSNLKLNFENKHVFLFIIFLNSVQIRLLGILCIATFVKHKKKTITWDRLYNFCVLHNNDAYLTDEYDSECSV